MKHDSRRIRPPTFVSCALTLPSAALVTLLALWCQPNDLPDIIDIFTQKPVLIALNVLPVWLFVMFMSCVCGNVFSGTAAANLMVCGLSIANRVKIQVRDEPVFPRDLLLLREVGSAMGEYEIDFQTSVIWTVLGVTVLFALLGFVLDAFPERLRNLPGRVISAAVCFTVLSLAIVTVLSSDDIYQELGASNPYRLSVVFNENGFPYNFFHQFTKYQVDRPAGYRHEQAVQWDDEPTPYQTAQSPDASGQSPENPAQSPDASAQSVHVVIVMDEAFSDITDDPVFAFDDTNDPLTNLHAVQSDPHAISLRLVVPGFAGGTANTEFDVLTGMQTNSLGTGTTSALRTVNRNLDSLFRVFAADGYHTSFFHPGDDWFYNRENVYHWFGAQTTLFIDQMETDYPMPEYKGRWVTDSYLAGLIQQEFSRTVENGQLLFHYTTTIQNHMSYPHSKYGDDYDYPPVPLNVTVPEDVQSMLDVYVEGVRDADHMLGQLREFFTDLADPVILVFYGDHLPYLGDDQYVYAALGMDIAAPDGQREDYFCIYETPCVIWANDAAADLLDWNNAVTSLDLPGHEKISAAFLGPTLLELTGRGEVNAWTAFLNRLRREVSVVHNAVWLMPDGVTVDTATASGNTSGANDKSPGVNGNTSGANDTASGNGAYDIAAISADIQKWRQWSYYKLRQKNLH